MMNWKEILNKLKVNKNTSLDDYNLSVEEEKLVQELIHANAVEESLVFLDEINIDKEWIIQQSLIANDQQDQVKKQPHFTRNLVKYAATVLLPLILFSAYYIDNKSYFSKTIANYNFSTVSHSKGFLILADGSKEELKNLELNQDNQLFKIIDGELLDYSTSEAQNLEPAYNTLVIPKGATYRLQLHDGTEVHLNENTTLRFPTHFQNTAERRITLEKGEAFFDVVNNDEKPFVVNTGSTEISVLGTSFNVEMKSDQLYTTLIEGKVKLTNMGSDVIITPNQQAIVSNGKKGIQVKNIDVSSFIAWHNNLWVFEQQRLEDIMFELTSWYDFDYEFVDTELKDIQYTANLEKYDSIEHVLQLLEKTEKVYFTIKRKKIFIHKVKHV